MKKCSAAIVLSRTFSVCWQRTANWENLSPKGQSVLQLCLMVGRYCLQIIFSSHVGVAWLPFLPPWPNTQQEAGLFWLRVVGSTVVLPGWSGMILHSSKNKWCFVYSLVNQEAEGDWGWKWGWTTNLLTLSDSLPPARLYLLKVPPPLQQHHPLGTKCSNTGACERNFTCEQQLACISMENTQGAFAFYFIFLSMQACSWDQLLH